MLQGEGCEVTKHGTGGFLAAKVFKLSSLDSVQVLNSMIGLNVSRSLAVKRHSRFLDHLIVF